MSNPAIPSGCRGPDCVFFDFFLRHEAGCCKVMADGTPLPPHPPLGAMNPVEDDDAMD